MQLIVSYIYKYLTLSVGYIELRIHYVKLLFPSNCGKTTLYLEYTFPSEVNFTFGLISRHSLLKAF